VTVEMSDPLDKYVVEALRLAAGKPGDMARTVFSRVIGMKRINPATGVSTAAPKLASSSSTTVIASATSNR